MSNQQSGNQLKFHDMGSLPRKLTREGFVMTQMLRKGRFAVYRRERLTTGATHFEVIKILVEPKTRKLPSGSIRKAGSERYPSSSDWGNSGWTFPDQASAERKFHGLASKRRS